MYVFNFTSSGYLKVSFIENVIEFLGKIFSKTPHNDCFIHFKRLCVLATQISDQ